MLVSWNWLKDYLTLDMPPAELVDRLMMAGLNHESSTPTGSDLVIDLEITSNRPDCLGHLGIAREIALLFDRALKIPQPTPPEAAESIESLVTVAVDCPEHCREYTARLVRGVRVGPSPAWLADRLVALGVGLVNNVVDVTNYVMLECGQPLHAFDFAKLAGGQIRVRTARSGEPFVAIDHREYALDVSNCVIADAERPVAVGGVMGGADSEVSATTVDVLVEAADFAALSIRNTARKLALHSPSSYRFERGVDPEQLDWASRRCCQLIVELAGGRLVRGVARAGQPPRSRSPVTLRLAQLRRVLGIDVPMDDVERILRALGCDQLKRETERITVTAPSWRRDLTREIDLVEDVARVYGYDRIPENVQVPMVPSQRTPRERILGSVRDVLTAAGFDEAMTVSLVTDDWSQAFSPWSAEPPLSADMSILRGANRLRRSLVPSLLDARRTNESLANPRADLFEVANVYLPRPGQLPDEQWTAAVVSGRGFSVVKGVIESLCSTLHLDEPLTVQSASEPLLHPDRSARISLGGQVLAILGELTPAGLKLFGLRGATVVAEIRMATLATAKLIPQAAPISQLPAISRDLNLVVDESVRWSDLAETVRSAAGGSLESLLYQETYRDPAKDGPHKKRLLFSFTLRSADRTLTGDEADGIARQVLNACAAKHAATLIG